MLFTHLYMGFVVVITKHVGHNVSADHTGNLRISILHDGALLAHGKYYLYILGLQNNFFSVKYTLYLFLFIFTP